MYQQSPDPGLPCDHGLVRRSVRRRWAGAQPVRQLLTRCPRFAACMSALQFEWWAAALR